MPHACHTAGYTTAHRAHIALKKIIGRERLERKHRDPYSYRLGVYRCDICQSYHIGNLVAEDHAKGRERAARKKKLR